MLAEGEIDKNFSVNFESLFAAFIARIRNEEDSLYEEHEEINRQEQTVDRMTIKRFKK